MKVFRKVFLYILIWVTGLVLFAQTSKNADIVILMDTSGTIFEYYEEINNTVLKVITDRFVRKGDTVHLLSFNADARYELSQKINTEADMSRIVSRFLLLYQLGQNSDFLTGLKYCTTYTENLAKKDEQILIIISDGIFNPPDSSPYKNYTGDQIKNELGLLSGKIRKQGWKVYYVKLPYPSDAVIKNLEGGFYADAKSEENKSSAESSIGGDSKGSKDNGFPKNTQDNDSVVNNLQDKITANNSQTESKTQNTGEKEYTDISKTFTEGTGIDQSKLSEKGGLTIEEDDKVLPQIIFPAELKAYGSKLNFSVEILNRSDKDTELKLSEVVIDNGINLVKIPVRKEKTVIRAQGKTVLDINAVLPGTYREGKYNAIVRLEFDEDKKITPQAAELLLFVYPSFISRTFKSNNLWLFIIGLLLLLLLIFIIVMIIKKKNSTKISASNVSGKKTSLKATSSGETPPLYFGEEKKVPVQLNDKENYTDKLNSFNSSVNSNNTINANSKNVVLNAGEGSGSIYSSANIDKIALQKTQDEALRLNILNSLSFQQDRGFKMVPANHLERIEIKRDQSGMTEIYVLDQNRNIGRRNIHVMKAGTRLTVGGGKKDNFLVFLVKLPANLAEVRYDGQDYHLAILKPEFFPYEKSNVINNCIGKTITIVSKKGYHIYFTFRAYEDPTVKLNNILTSIK